MATLTISADNSSTVTIDDSAVTLTVDTVSINAIQLQGSAIANAIPDIGDNLQYKIDGWTPVKQFSPINLYGYFIFYVSDSTGDDTTGDGSQDAPFKTISRAVDNLPTVIDGDYYIYVADGTYRMPYTYIRNYLGGYGHINIIGNTAHPENVILRGDTEEAPEVAYDRRALHIDTSGCGAFYISGMTFKYFTDAAIASWAQGGAYISNCIFEQAGPSGGISLNGLHYGHMGPNITITGRNPMSYADYGMRLRNCGWIMLNSDITINNCRYGLYVSEGTRFCAAEKRVICTNSTGVHASSYALKCSQDANIANLKLTASGFKDAVILEDKCYLDLNALTVAGNTERGINAGNACTADVEKITQITPLATVYTVAPGALIDARGDGIYSRVVRGTTAAAVTPTENTPGLEGEMLYDANYIWVRTGGVWKSVGFDKKEQITFNLPAITGSYVDIGIPFAGTIDGWELIADVAGSVTLDVQTTTYAALNFASIAAAAKPSLSGVQKNTDSTLTGWTTSVAEDSYIRVIVEATPVTVAQLMFVLIIDRG